VKVRKQKDIFIREETRRSVAVFLFAKDIGTAVIILRLRCGNFPRGVVARVNNCVCVWGGGGGGGKIFPFLKARKARAGSPPVPPSQYKRFLLLCFSYL
jgi:hypothetical protein